MSKWYQPKAEDIERDKDVLNVYLDSDDQGNIYAELKVEEVEAALKTTGMTVGDVIQIIEKNKADERKVVVFGDWEARTYEEKMLVNAAFDYLIKELRKKPFTKLLK